MKSGIVVMVDVAVIVIIRLTHILMNFLVCIT